jgi:hypothetical protein
VFAIGGVALYVDKPESSWVESRQPWRKNDEDGDEPPSVAKTKRREVIKKERR